MFARFHKGFNRKILIRESTVYFKYDWESLELNRMTFSLFNEQPPVDSSFIDLFHKFKQIDTNTIDLNFLTKCSNKDSINIFKDELYQSFFKRRGNGYKNFTNILKIIIAFTNFQK